MFPLAGDKFGKGFVVGDVDGKVGVEIDEFVIGEEPLGVDVDQADQLLEDCFFAFVA